MREIWQEKAPGLFNPITNFTLYHDINKRIAVIRELFEECNLLLATYEQDGKPPSGATLSRFESEYKDNFSRFCLNYGLTPQLDNLYAYRRIATRYGSPIIHDT